LCGTRLIPAEARRRGDNWRGGALTWRYDVCQGPVTLAEFDHDCRMTRWYVRGVGVAEGIGDVVAEVDVSGESPKPHYYLYNHRGDVLVVLNPDGAANSTFRYDAFGNYYQMTGPFTPRYTFSTKEYLPAAGLYLYQYRVYDPVAGRWTQRDPIDYQDSVNLYQFCGNNPITAVDPDGRDIHYVPGIHPYVLIDVRNARGEVTGRYRVDFSAKVWKDAQAGKIDPLQLAITLLKAHFLGAVDGQVLVTEIEGVDPLPKGTKTRQTTSQEDDATLKRVRELEKAPPSYNQCNFCVNFADEVYSRGKDAYKPREERKEKQDGKR